MIAATHCSSADDRLYALRQALKKGTDVVGWALVVPQHSGQSQPVGGAADVAQGREQQHAAREPSVVGPKLEQQRGRDVRADGVAWEIYGVFAKADTPMQSTTK